MQSKHVITLKSTIILLGPRLTTVGLVCGLFNVFEWEHDLIYKTMFG